MRSVRADVVVAGGGMVGLTLGIALARAGVATVVVDGMPPDAVRAAGFDGRASSFADASCRMLETLGLWTAVSANAAPVLDIVVGDGSVREGASAALLHFDHSDIGDRPLAHMIENRHFRLALQDVAEKEANLTMIAPARVVRAVPVGDGIQAELDDGAVIAASVCVAADGRGSPLRDAAGIRTSGWSYAQTGIVATVAHEKPHAGTAHELFLPSGPFAILPMTGNRSSIVWTEREDLAPSFLKLDDGAFLSELAQRFGDHLGALTLEGPRWSYPLSMQIAHSYVAGRLVLAGDAAHAVHPLAGQGLNLGLRDAAALAETIVNAKRLGLDPGSAVVLAQYERWRRFDNAMFTAGMDLLNRLFSNDLVPLRLARRAGLDLVDAIAPLKRFFMERAAGHAADNPRLLRGEPL